MVVVQVGVGHKIHISRERVILVGSGHLVHIPKIRVVVVVMRIMDEGQMRNQIRESREGQRGLDED